MTGESKHAHIVLGYRMNRGILRTFMLAASTMILPMQQALADAPQSQRDALTAFYNTHGGPGWTAAQHWNTADPVCGPDPWFGITCDPGDTTVTRIQLSNNGLTGALPADFSAWPDLEMFAVNDNALAGAIPSTLLNGAAHLVSFIAYSNDLTGSVPALSGAPLLQELQLANNQLSGSFPDLSALAGLELLDVSGNELSGTLAANAFTVLPVLRYVRISQNQLSGPLPAPPPSLDVDTQNTALNSWICPNYFDPAASPESANDLVWDLATDETPWSTFCSPSPGTTQTVTTLFATPSPAPIGQPVSFSVTVTPVGGGGIPTGSVTVSGGGKSCVITLVNSAGACMLVFTLEATLHMSAIYSGDIEFDPSTVSTTHIVAAGIIPPGIVPATPVPGLSPVMLPALTAALAALGWRRRGARSRAARRVPAKRAG